jgi:predicted O-linked N-acetylglucosamine transferase (SPINDLY family)
MHLLGVVAHQKGENENALELIQQAIQSEPNTAFYYCSLGDVYSDLGNITDAIFSYQKAIELKPELVEVHFNMGNAYQVHGQLDEAIASYQKALVLKPDLAVAHQNIAAAFNKSGDFDQAIFHYQKFLNLKPDDATAYNKIGNIFKIQGKLNQAITTYQKALEVKPDLASIHNNLGSAFEERGNLHQAIAAYRHALKLNPDYAEAHSNMGIVCKEKGDVTGAVACFRKALALDPDYWRAHSNLMFCMHYDEDYEREEIFLESQHWWRRHAPEGVQCYSHHNHPDPDRRLKVGYVSPDFRQHSVSYFFLPLLGAHDRHHVEVFCYSAVKRPDPMTEHLQHLADHWISIVGFTDEAAARQIDKDGIDILVDLAGHSAGHRLLVFARKPAPVQVSWLGYPNTTGLATMDYRFTDEVADPVGVADQHHSETLVRLSHGFLCFAAPQIALEVGELPAAKTGRITFGSFNTLPKINARVIELWSRILHQVPGSSLLLKCRQLADEPTRQAYAELFAQQGIGAERITMLPQTPSTREHLALYNQMDIGLDPFPYNGTTTTCEALWMGVPVLTLRGDRHSARVGASILMRVGLQEWIAESQADYVNKAVALAVDKARLARLRSQLREKLKNSSLCDADGFARGVETAFRMMWQAWCRKKSKD